MKSILVLVLAASASASFAADVHGKIVLSQGRAASHAVVYLEGGPKSRPLANAMVDQRGRTFIPHISVITIGTTVSFPNNDTIFHNVFAEYSKEDRFDIGMYARGATKRHTFSKPGVVAVMCSVHPDMSAYIVVIDTPYYTVADSNGEYAIKNVPAGSYTLKVWHESGQVESKRIEVADNRSVDVKTHHT